MASAYLTLYNSVSFALWFTVTVRMALLVPILGPNGHLPAVFEALFWPLLFGTQSLALLEVVHSLVGLVRAPVVTTAMQVASRLLVVWGVMRPFQGIILGGDHDRSAPVGDGAKLGDYAFIGCLVAWGITECIRYSFFALQVSGMGVPAFLTWLRYNTFYVLYPIGITSECTLIYLALGPAADIDPVYAGFLITVLVIYVPGSYVLYTHMMAQRRRIMRGKKRAD